MARDIAEMEARILRALSNPIRIRIVEFLKGGEKCVCEIYPELGVEQSNLSRHLSVMKSAGIISDRRQGINIYYSVTDGRIFNLLDLVSEILKSQLERDRELIELI